MFGSATIPSLVPTARVGSSHAVSSRKLTCGDVKSFLNLSAILKAHIFECLKGSPGLCICQGPGQVTLLEVGRVAAALAGLVKGSSAPGDLSSGS